MKKIIRFTLPLIVSCLFLLFSMRGGQAQDLTVSGIVQDEAGTPVVGATVQVLDTDMGTVTNVSGQYSISVPEDAVLVFRAIGYSAQREEVDGRSTVNVTMTTDISKLNELVVTAFGVEKSEKSLGYSVSNVNPDELVQHSEPDILKSLQGQVAGVDIRTSEGAPGAASRINIRGATSFFGSNEPLIVVDGVTFDNSVNLIDDLLTNGGAPSNGLSALDPNDIESLAVLKGATAAALYGSRASNGVLVIKTKSGSFSRSNKGMEVTYKSSVSFEKIASIPDYQNKYGAGAGFAYQNANGSWGPAFSSLDSIPTWGEYKSNFPDMFGDKVPYKAYPNNVKDLFRTGTVWENSVSASGGNEKSSINTVASLLRHNGYIPNSNYRKSNISIGGVTELINGLHVRGNLSYANTTQLGGIFGENQVDGVSSSFARSLFLARNWDLNLPYEDLDGHPVSTSSSQYDNPRWSYIHNTISTKTDRTVANLRFDYNILPWMNASYQIGTNTYNSNSKRIIDLGSRAADGKGELLMYEFHDQTIESNFLLTMTPKLNNEDFGLKAILGHNVFQDDFRRSWTKGTEIVAPGIYTIGNTKTQTGDSYTEKRRIFGVFADVTLSYKDYLFLELTGRNDWSSTLPQANRSYFYPSVSGSFVFSEAFEIQNETFSNGRIRASWSKVGHDADPYKLFDTYRVGDPFLGQAMAHIYSEANNPDLKPEFTSEYEIGTHLEFFKSRIGVDFTYYHSNSTNQIAPVTLPSSTGYEQAIQNFGELENHGIEIQLDVIPVHTPSFQWDLRWTFTQNRTKVISLTEGLDRISLYAILTDLGPFIEPNLPFGYIRGTKSMRDDEGNLLIDPATGFVINDPEEGMIGDPNPKFKSGLMNRFKYKGFFLNVLFDYTHGGDLYSVTLSSELGRGVTKDTEDRETSWVIDGVYGDVNTLEPIKNSKGEKIRNVTKVSTNDLFFTTGGSGSTFAINAQNEWNVWDASVWHLRDLTFGYEFPRSVLKGLPFGSASLSFSGRNLWYFAPNVPAASNFDPESQTYSNSAQGFEFSAAPTMRRYGVNLKVTF